MLVPDAMSTEVDLVPVLDMVPLDFLPPLSLPSEADLLRLLHGQSPQPCKIKTRKARCSEEIETMAPFVVLHYIPWMLSAKFAARWFLLNLVFFLNTISGAL